MTTTSAADLQRAPFTTPHQTVPETDPTEPPPAPLQNKGSDLEVDNLALEGVAPELATKKRSSQSLQARLNFDPEYKASPPRHQKEKRKRDSRRPLIFTRIGKKVVGLGRRRSLSESPPSSDSEDSRRKRRKREDEDMSRPWRRQKVDAFTRCISDFLEDKRRHIPANVKTYDGTGDPELVGNARNWFSKLPRRSIDGIEELRRAFRLNFTQRKKCAKNHVELARVKQRQGESTSAYVERYKDECIHVKTCPKILKISGFMNGINNPELIKRLNDMVP
nr:reverse transcriptase domain-containing protein [Tanacetum cinerariifolium]